MIKIFRATKDKEALRKKAIKEGRKVLWMDNNKEWRAATDLRNTPWFALEIEELFPTLNYSRIDWEKGKNLYSKVNKNV